MQGDTEPQDGTVDVDGFAVVTMFWYTNDSRPNTSQSQTASLSPGAMVPANTIQTGPIRAEYSCETGHKSIMGLLSEYFVRDLPQTRVSLSRISDLMHGSGHYHNVLTGPFFSGCTASSFKAGYEPERAIRSEGRWSSDRESAGAWWRVELSREHMVTCLRITQPGGDGDTAGENLCVCVYVCMCVHVFAYKSA
jgi:hypothetical protein